MMTGTLGQAEQGWKASASDAALLAYLRQLAELYAGTLVHQANSWRAPRPGSLNPGPKARDRNSLGLRLVQRRNAR